MSNHFACIVSSNFRMYDEAPAAEVEYWRKEHDELDPDPYHVKSAVGYLSTQVDPDSAS